MASDILFSNSNHGFQPGIIHGPVHGPVHAEFHAPGKSVAGGSAVRALQGPSQR